MERKVEDDLHRPTQEAAPETSRRARFVAVTREAVAARGREPRPDRDVGRPRANYFEQPPEFADRVLAVGVEPPAVGVAAFGCVPVAGRDRSAKAAILAERENFGAVLAGDVGSPVDRPVVDDEHVGVRDLLAELYEDGRQIPLLVPRWDEDERVAGLGHWAQNLSEPAALQPPAQMTMGPTE